jgi:hypothetical protein
MVFAYAFSWTSFGGGMKAPRRTCRREDPLERDPSSFRRIAHSCFGTLETAENNLVLAYQDGAAIADVASLARELAGSGLSAFVESGEISFAHPRPEAFGQVPARIRYVHGPDGTDQPGSEIEGKPYASRPLTLFVGVRSDGVEGSRESAPRSDP